MNKWLTWQNISRAIGVGVILLGASTWPDVNGGLVMAGLGFIGGADAFSGLGRQRPA